MSPRAYASHRLKMWQEIRRIWELRQHQTSNNTNTGMRATARTRSVCYAKRKMWQDCTECRRMLSTVEEASLEFHFATGRLLYATSGAYFTIQPLALDKRNFKWSRRQTRHAFWREQHRWRALKLSTVNYVLLTWMRQLTAMWRFRRKFSSTLSASTWWGAEIPTIGLWTPGGLLNSHENMHPANIKARSIRGGNKKKLWLWISVFIAVPIIHELTANQ